MLPVVNSRHDTASMTEAMSQLHHRLGELLDDVQARADALRNDIQAKYYAANNLRNLAFHQEPIFDLRSLEDDCHRTYEGIAWIDPTMPAKIQLFDRFFGVHGNGRVSIGATLREHFGISGESRQRWYGGAPPTLSIVAACFFGISLPT